MGYTESELAHLNWRKQRIDSVTGHQGSLSLIAMIWRDGNEPPLSDKEILAPYPAHATVSRLRRRHIETGELEQGYRVWQHDSAANQSFDRIEAFDYNNDFRIDAIFEYVHEHRTIGIDHINDAGKPRQHSVPGDVTFTQDGVHYRLSAFDLGDVLQLVFLDRTTGRETYTVGRFLYIERPNFPPFPHAGQRFPITLDFNFAIVPPCGFSSLMNCPVPPPENRLEFAVLAGEKIPVFIDDREPDGAGSSP